MLNEVEEDDKLEEAEMREAPTAIIRQNNAGVNETEPIQMHQFMHILFVLTIVSADVLYRVMFIGVHSSTSNAAAIRLIEFDFVYYCVCLFYIVLTRDTGFHRRLLRVRQEAPVIRQINEDLRAEYQVETDQFSNARFRRLGGTNEVDTEQLHRVRLTAPFHRNTRGVNDTEPMVLHGFTPMT